ncbi:hypothetical protein QYE76_049532 [Lolium multiflorum]|uniref:Transposase-associated domain-containing protein n=1 Tax=Lolium multiflorum TaxID=4521 RepID=A0AAD8WIF6_LOLMU|nr:hypothetical protein QYE76_049532 [Lolium multiflorum]
MEGRRGHLRPGLARASASASTRLPPICVFLRWALPLRPVVATAGPLLPRPDLAAAHQRVRSVRPPACMRRRHPAPPPARRGARPAPPALPHSHRLPCRRHPAAVASTPSRRGARPPPPSRAARRAVRRFLPPLYQGERGVGTAPIRKEGVNSFLLVAEANKSKQGFMCCPCLKCKNEKDYSCSRDIKSHLLRFGFMSSYNVWTKHGEEGVMMEDGDEEEDNDDQYRSMFSECDDTAMDDNEEEGGEEQASDDLVDDDLRRAISDARRDCGTDKERLQFDKMLEDHHKLLYPGCEDGHRKLGSILELLKWKAEVGVTDSGFEKLMIILKKLFPRNNELPVSTYEAKKLVCPLGLDVRRYMHALMIVSSTAVRSTRI